MQHSSRSTARVQAKLFHVSKVSAVAAARLLVDVLSRPFLTVVCRWTLTCCLEALPAIGELHPVCEQTGVEP